MSFMKLIILSIILTIFVGSIHAQGVTLPAASATQATVPWSLPSNCTATNTCQIQVYRLAGICPGTLAGSTGWTLVGTTAAQATSFLDTTVVGGTQYSYDAEAVPTGSSTVYSGPSNCVSVTVPFAPQPPVLGTPTAI